MFTLRKKVEPVENGATLEGGAVFLLNNHFLEKKGASDQSGTVLQKGTFF